MRPISPCPVAGRSEHRGPGVSSQLDAQRKPVISSQSCRRYKHDRLSLQQSLFQTELVSLNPAIQFVVDFARHGTREGLQVCCVRLGRPQQPGRRGGAARARETTWWIMYFMHVVSHPIMYGTPGTGMPGLSDNNLKNLKNFLSNALKHSSHLDLKNGNQAWHLEGWDELYNIHFMLYTTWFLPVAISGYPSHDHDNMNLKAGCVTWYIACHQIGYVTHNHFI